MYCKNFIQNIILRRNERTSMADVQMSSCKVPVVLVIFSWNMNFLYRFSKNTHISNFMEIRLVGAELLHADGQTDRQTRRS